MFKDEKVNYTDYLAGKPQETDPAKLATMKEALTAALKARDIYGHISAVYYTDGCVKVSVNSEYYGVFDSNTGKFFSGYVGD